MLLDFRNIIEFCVLQLPLLYFTTLAFLPPSPTSETVLFAADTPANMSLARVTRTVVNKVLAVEQQEVRVST